MKPSYFSEQAYLESRQIMRNCIENLELCLADRGQSKKDFLKWVQLQGMPEAKRTRYNRYPSDKDNDRELDTDHLSAIVLISKYTEIPTQELMFGKYIGKNTHLSYR